MHDANRGAEHKKENRTLLTGIIDSFENEYAVSVWVDNRTFFVAKMCTMCNKENFCCLEAHPVDYINLTGQKQSIESIREVVIFPTICQGAVTTI